MKNMLTLALILLINLFASSVLIADDVLYARYPALSPDGQTIAFTYMGDIWTVDASGGRAQRLTVHEAEDIQPHYSPDGKNILFSSSRLKNFDTYIIPAEGGTPKQLTVHSAADIGTGWTPKGDTAIFYSRREGFNDIYKVSITGGTPIKLTGYYKEHETNGRISSDGQYMLFNFGGASRRWWRRDLQSSRNGDIYLQDRKAESFTSRRLTSEMGHEVWPVLNESAGEFYFIACRGEWAQVWRQPLDGGTATAMTEFKGDGAQWLNSNPQGTLLVFEQGFKIWTLNPATGELKTIPIDIKSDERGNISRVETFKGDVQWYSISPDERKIAVSIHGEVFIIPAEEPETGRRVTFTAGRESFPVWGADSKILFYSSDRNGNSDIYKIDVVTGDETQLTTSPENEIKPVVSPDGKYLAFYRGLKQIIKYDIANDKETVWIEAVLFDLGIEPTIEYDWSPDSKWFAFTGGGATYETNIFISDLEGNTTDISQLSGYNYRPRFSSDGKKVFFSRWNEGKTQTYEISLTHEPNEFYESSFDSLFLDEPESESDKDDKKKDGNEVTPVEIDFSRIVQRRKLAFTLSASSDYPVLTPDGDKYLFLANIMGKQEIWSVNTDGDLELTQISKGGGGKSNLRMSDDGKWVFFLENGKIKKAAVAGGKQETLSFSASMDVDEFALNHQKFSETWQMLNTYFYDSGFHGTNWAEVYEKYEPVVSHVRTEDEFRNLIMELLGELRASHLYIYSKQGGPDAQNVTGETGIFWDYKLIERDGSYKVADVIPESPADLAGIKSGMYVTAINGRELSGGTNLFSLLAGLKGRRVIFSTGNRPHKGETEIAVKPTDRGTLETAYYKYWVEQRRQRVDSLSDGRLAYLHIRSMSGRYLNQFKEELVAIAELKDGVIIDVRDNGGGNIAVHLLGILVKTPYFLRTFRDFPATTENKMRSKALEKPMTLLINNYSASNSEIFAEGFRQLKLGKIIGEPTAGAVIGTGSYTLIDGTRVRRPSWGAFTVGMEDTDKIRRQPDILIEHGPDDFINGHDKQLERAVSELLKEL